MYTRQDYLDGVCEHRQYYAQWDIIAKYVPPATINHLYAAGDTDSLAGRICILREAARQIVEES